MRRRRHRSGQLALSQLLWAGCFNIRDIGGHETATGRKIRSGSLVRADNLYRLTEAGQAALREYGVTTIIDLRGRQELEEHPSPFAGSPNGSVRYHHLPFIEDTNEAAMEAMRAASSVDQTYRVMLEHFAPSVARIMTAIARAPEGVVLFHCHAGKDRTGLTAALLLALAGVPYETIVRDYALSDTNLEPLYREWAGEVPEDEIERMTQRYRTPAEAMALTLAYLDQEYGGAEGYLLRAGVSTEDIERLKERLLQ